MGTDTFCIVPVEFLESLDFSTVKDDNIDTVRRSLDGALAVIFWEGDAPEGIEWQTYNEHEIRQLMRTEKWQDEFII